MEVPYHSVHTTLHRKITIKRPRFKNADHDSASIRVRSAVQDEEDDPYSNRVVYHDEDEPPLYHPSTSGV